MRMVPVYNLPHCSDNFKDPKPEVIDPEEPAIALKWAKEGFPTYEATDVVFLLDRPEPEKATMKSTLKMLYACFTSPKSLKGHVIDQFYDCGIVRVRTPQTLVFSLDTEWGRRFGYFPGKKNPNLEGHADVSYLLRSVKKYLIDKLSLGAAHKFVLREDIDEAVPWLARSPWEPDCAGFETIQAAEFLRNDGYLKDCHDSHMFWDKWDSERRKLPYEERVKVAFNAAYDMVADEVKNQPPLGVGVRSMDSLSELRMAGLPNYIHGNYSLPHTVGLGPLVNLFLKYLGIPTSHTHAYTLDKDMLTLLNWIGLLLAVYPIAHLTFMRSLGYLHTIPMNYYVYHTEHELRYINRGECFWATLFWVGVFVGAGTWWQKFVTAKKEITLLWCLGYDDDSLLLTIEDIRRSKRPPRSQEYSKQGDVQGGDRGDISGFFR